jgi:dihydrofolate reductase
MGTLYSSHFITLDGVVSDPHVWHPRYASGESVERLLGEMNATSTHLLGRTTYTEFASFWPTQTGPIADVTNVIPKHVVSRSLSDVDASWGDTTVLRGDPAEEVARLKEDHDIVGVHGSGTLVRALLAAGLIDEVRLTLDPVVIGEGRRLFSEADTPSADLELVDVATYPLGVVQLTYRPTS